MAKLRRNHKQSGNVLSIAVIRVAAFVLIGGFAVFYISESLKKEISFPSESEYEIPAATNPEERFYIPISPSKEIVNHKYYSLAYNEEHEQAEWVAYELSKSQLLLPNVERETQFRPDPAVQTKSALHRDYINSGFTRGHLAPAGDMAFNEEAMTQSFFMSNISPQLESFNVGIWNELENDVRDWAFDNGRVYVVTGPVLNGPILKKIGENKVSVPKYFYKVILEIQGKEKNGIGFIIENDRSDIHLKEYAVSIDSVENFTGYDFFPDLMIDELEEEIESKFDVSKWRFDPKRFEMRNEKWQH